MKIDDSSAIINELSYMKSRLTYFQSSPDGDFPVLCLPSLSKDQVERFIDRAISYIKIVDTDRSKYLEKLDSIVSAFMSGGYDEGSH